MARREVTAGRKADRKDDELLRLALSIKAFCELHSISEDFYYKLKREHRGPVEMQVGRRVLISREAARAWRRASERASADQQLSA